MNKDSWFTIHHLELNMEFLNKDIEVWPFLDEFKSSKRIINNLNVTNDAAERAVKLTADFLDTARKESKFQTILQVVESNRKSKTNIRKLNNKVEEYIIFIKVFILF